MIKDIGEDITMGNGKEIFKVITNDDIYDEIQDLKKMIIEHNKRLGKIQQQVKWHQRIAIFLIPAYGSVIWYLITLMR